MARPVEPEDLLKTVTVSEPSLSPDGRQVAYTVETADLEEDTNVSHIWVASSDGTGERQLTGREGESETTPKFSPDGSSLGFLSSRGKKDDAPTQLWLLPLAGGEAQPIKGVTGSVSDFAWSPDGTKLALIVKDPKPELDQKLKDRPQPIVIDRYWFKTDYEGFRDNRRERLWLYDLKTGSLKRVTDGDFDQALPAFSPDGREIAFVSNRTAEPDRNSNTDIFVADISSPGAAPRQITTFEGPDSENYYPAWSPDGETIAYVRGGDPAKIWYAVSSLALVDAKGGDPTILTPDLDRNVEHPVWSEDGKAVRFVVEDDRRRYLASVRLDQPVVEPLAFGDYELGALTPVRSGRMALTRVSDFTPPEIFVFADNALSKVSSRNDGWLADLEFGTARRAEFTSPDGTQVNGFIYLPAGYRPGKAYPTVLSLHGGPASQYAHGWDQEILSQLAARYVVVAPNPRGSTGRGEAYAMAGHSAWGALDVQDVLAMVDGAVAEGIADPERLGVSGWSYGGMLTNYVIASDTRFKAAVSGSSISNIITGFGHDMYIREYIAELGTPWENLETWMAISYPFFENQRIQTPTLFIVGEEDVNVPTIASEQMYQALKHRGIDTQLVIYPGEYHGISRPSFQLDRIKRWNAWMDKYLKD
ncbi:S9 family peptidase [Altererythrobacter sp. GH1-8]|uniref:S9 family peptidase n=1 Tax=Altererythrobacter sp. GH1-8 TaxID=3349333 RepID=UPI00374D2538